MLLVASVAVARFLSTVGQPAVTGGSNAVTSAPSQVILTVDPTHPGAEFALGAVGLSIEGRELSTHDLSDTHRSLVALMGPLGPGVLRIGGNSSDYAWWTSDGEQAPAWATSVVTPVDLARLRALLQATGWRVILGVDFGHFDPARAADEAREAERILGSRLLGIEIGNEPNDYGLPLVGLRPSSYSASDYLRELALYTEAIRAVVPEMRLYGPDLGSLASQTWMSPIVSNASLPFAAITLHYYPTTYSFAKGACKGTSVPTARELLSPEVRERENAALQIMVGAGDAAHRETVISETNDTSSCDAPGGPKTSPVFASALWSLDWALRAGSAGAGGVNFHGYLGLCRPEAFTPICSPNKAAEARGRVVARPEYYGLLAARQLEGGRFVPVTVKGQDSAGSITAYATMRSPDAISLAVENLAGEGVSTVGLQVPGFPKASFEALTATSIRATGGVTFGHASFSRGARRPTPTTVPRVHGVFQLKLRAGSAVVVMLKR